MIATEYKKDIWGRRASGDGPGTTTVLLYTSTYTYMRLVQVFEGDLPRQDVDESKRTVNNKENKLIDKICTFLHTCVCQYKYRGL